MNIKQRNIVTAVILSFVTCGIYMIYWAVCLARDSVSVKDPNDSAVLEIVLMIFFPFVGCYLAEKKFTEGCAAKGIPHKDNSVVYLIAGFFIPFIPFCMMQNDLNQIAGPAQQ